ncbi:MAG: hypothetical protein VX899_11200 [Myxococcota bacterium]|nr:hypothetical protein [Myxococcota bacterium]
MLSIWLSLLACSGPDSPKRWLRFEPFGLPGEAGLEEGLIPSRYCGDGGFMSPGDRLWTAEGEELPLQEETPKNGVTGETGPVSCVGDRRFTAAPDRMGAYVSEAGGPWELLPLPAEDVTASSLVSDSEGVLWRTLYAHNDARPVTVERSDDGGVSWEGTAIAPVNAEGSAEDARLYHAEGFLEMSVFELSAERNGRMRVKADGSESVLGINGSIDWDTTVPLPLRVLDGESLSWGSVNPPEGSPTWHLPTMYVGGEPWDAEHEGLEPVLLIGPQLFGHGNGGATLERLIVDDEDHLILPSPIGLLRSTTPWTEDLRDEVLLDRSCALLETHQEGLGHADGPQSVEVENQSGGPVMLATFAGNTTMNWVGEQVLGDDGAYRPGTLEDGETWTVEAGGQYIVVLDDGFRCLQVVEGDPGQVVIQ